MKYEKEYAPKDSVEDKIFVLVNGKAVQVDVEDDDDDPIDEEEPHVDYD